MTSVYRGIRRTLPTGATRTEVWVVQPNGVERPLPWTGKWAADHPDTPTPAQPTHEWGYGGTGPADLAASILAHHVGRPVGNPLVQAFKRSFTGPFPREGFELASALVTLWCEQHVTELANDHAARQFVPCPGPACGAAKAAGAGDDLHRGDQSDPYPATCDLCRGLGEVTRAEADAW